MTRLVFYTVYDHPCDFPHSFVVRRWTLVEGDQGELVKVADLLPMAVGPTLDAVRTALPEGLYNIGRHEEDEPQIVESWVWEPPIDCTCNSDPLGRCVVHGAAMEEH